MRRWGRRLVRSRCVRRYLGRTRSCRPSGDESGQALIEYVLLLAFCIVAAGALGKRLTQAIDKSVLRIAGQLEKDLKSGRSSLNTWVN
jgi:hypothetical protein